MNKEKFLKILDDRKDDLHHYLQEHKAHWVSIDVLEKATTTVGNIVAAMRDCPEVFAELDEDQISIIVATLQFEDFIADMSDSYQTTLSEQSQNSSLRRKLSELIGQRLPKEL